jgi:hypothetical protein
MQAASAPAQAIRDRRRQADRPYRYARVMPPPRRTWLLVKDQVRPRGELKDLVVAHDAIIELEEDVEAVAGGAGDCRVTGSGLVIRYGAISYGDVAVDAGEAAAVSAQAVCEGEEFEADICRLNFYRAIHGAAVNYGF